MPIPDSRIQQAAAVRFIRRGRQRGWIAREDDPAKPSELRASPDRRSRRWFTLGAAFALVGILPDVDLLFRAHSAYTHSIGAVSLVFAGALLVPARHRLRVAVAMAAAYASHLALDWANEDTSVPIGIMALWPFSDAHYHAGLNVFFATDRRYWLDGFLWRNLRSIAWELLVLVPLAVGVWRLRTRGFGDPKGGPEDAAS